MTNSISVFVSSKIRFFISFHYVQMSINFFYEDGRGNIVDEQGHEAMDLEEEADPYSLGTLMTLSQ